MVLRDFLGKFVEVQIYRMRYNTNNHHNYWFCCCRWGRSHPILTQEKRYAYKKQKTILNSFFFFKILQLYFSEYIRLNSLIFNQMQKIDHYHN